MIDTRRVRADLGALARECRALKDMLTTTWTRPMAAEQRKLGRLRWRVNADVNAKVNADGGTR